MTLFKFRNRLADYVNNFKWYYFIFPTIGMLLGSLVFDILFGSLNISWLNALSPILTFLFLAIISLGLVRWFQPWSVTPSKACMPLDQS